MVLKKIKDFLFSTPQDHDEKKKEEEEKKEVKPQEQLKPYQMYDENPALLICELCYHRIAEEDKKTLAGGHKVHKQCFRKKKNETKKQVPYR